MARQQATLPPEYQPEEERHITPEEAVSMRNAAEMARELPLSNTMAGMIRDGLSYTEIAENARKQLGGVESVRDYVDPRVDKYSPTAESVDWEGAEAEALYDNVGPGCHVVWKRKAGTYAGDRDEVADMMYRIPEAKPVIRKSDGQQVESWDVLAYSVPVKYRHKQVLDEIDRYNRWVQDIDQETIHGSVTRKHPHYEDKKHEIHRDALDRSKRMGLGVRGVSPGAGFGEYEEGYRRALKMIPESERRAQEDNSRRGGRHVTLEEDQAARLDNSRRGGGLGNREARR